MRFHFAITVVFAVVLAITPVTLAIVQLGNLGGITLVLCTGAGTQTVTLDANGEPVLPMHPCPDCVAAITMQDVPAQAELLLADFGARLVAFSQFSRDAAARTPPAAFARGPPAMM